VHPGDISFRVGLGCFSLGHKMVTHGGPFYCAEVDVSGGMDGEDAVVSVPEKATKQELKASDKEDTPALGVN
jgi:hypothetical protein